MATAFAITSGIPRGSSRSFVFCKPSLLTVHNCRSRLRKQRSSLVSERHFARSVRWEPVQCQKGFGETKKDEKKKARRQQQADPDNYDGDYPVTPFSRSERLPEAVSKRMLARMVGFSAPPFFLALGCLPIFYFLSKNEILTFTPIIPFATASTLFLVSLLGISYGLVSTSWDPKEEGSKLGFEEFKTNLPNLIEALKGFGKSGGL